MITKTRIGNHLRRHELGDIEMFRRGFKEGVAFAATLTPYKAIAAARMQGAREMRSRCFESITAMIRALGETK